ncbi:4HBT domain-containing protein [Mycena indigotica]|uniref:4HBT domain-containing protein n=1 Tax=Mycena indigotica TaxID=2126181 RepID=A0A8H6RZD4_9AGAR|nr:4HBT domain-containing protein [Mycena indigotica]KAF7289791.1 4HBT domain-containing protein [Mycena indigotica]
MESSNSENPPATKPSSDAQVLSHVQTVLTNYLTSSPIYQLLLSSVILTAATTGLQSVLCLILGPPFIAVLTVLHGSLSATIIDLVGGLVVASAGSAKTGVSTDMHISFVGTAREGDTLFIEGSAERVGSTLAFARVTIEKEDEAGGRAVVAAGSHTKYVK